jgi:hypothetical protein
MYQTILLAAAPTALAFIQAGFPTSRNLTLIEGKPLLVHALESSVHPSVPANVVLNKEEESSVYNSRSAIEKHPMVERLVESPSSAQGALVSALLGASSLELELPLLVAPGDAVLRLPFSEILASINTELSALTLAFRSSNPRWSYLRQDTNQNVLEVVEKRVVGALATTGHFYFRQAKDFVDAAGWVLLNNAKVEGRFFVSTALNYLISKGAGIHPVEISRSDYLSYSKPFDFIRQDE